jgi:hypothetical protein
MGAGRIENGAFELKGRADERFASSATRFVGSFNLRDARILPDGPWPETQALDANVEWNGSRVRASVDEGRAGAFQLESVEARGCGRRRRRFTGRAHGGWSKLAWARAHPELQQHAPHLQELLHGRHRVRLRCHRPVATPEFVIDRRARVTTVLEGVRSRWRQVGRPSIPARRSTYDSGGCSARPAPPARWAAHPEDVSGAIAGHVAAVQAQVSRRAQARCAVAIHHLAQER